MWVKYNANPAGKLVGDCVIRAISTATGAGWEDTYIGVCLQGLADQDMPSSNAVWGSYLRRHGFTRRFMPDQCPDCYTAMDFCRDHPNGIYILAFASHVAAIIDGDYYDTWDSGAELPIYYWAKEDK